MALDEEDELTAEEFLLTKPCLEEVSGFLQGFPCFTPVLTDDEKNRINAYREDLMSGKVIPAPSHLRRAYTYRPGLRPVKVKKALP